MTKFISARARFSGELGGIKTEQLRGLDYNKEKLHERIEEVDNKLSTVGIFMDEYFFQKEKDDRDNGEFDHLITESDEREYYRYSPNTTDELSEDINICKYIQAYASYILNSKDLPKEKQQAYSILSEEEFKKQLLKEMSTDFKADAGVVMDTRPTNDYNNMDSKITKKDLYPHLQDNKYGIRQKDIELAKVLNEYETLREHVRGEMAKLKAGEPTYLTLYQMKSILASVMGDMHDSKKMILGVRSQAKRLGDESPFNDYSALDYSNVEHIKACLKHCPLGTPKPDVMTSHIGYDLQVAINKLSKTKKLDAIDMEIIDCYNSGRYTIRDIANEIERDSKTIQQRLDKICKRIAEVI